MFCSNNCAGGGLDEYVFENGVTIIGMSNLPGEVAKDASQVYGAKFRVEEGERLRKRRRELYQINIEDVQKWLRFTNKRRHIETITRKKCELQRCYI